MESAQFYRMPVVTAAVPPITPQNGGGTVVIIDDGASDWSRIRAVLAAARIDMVLRDHMPEDLLHDRGAGPVCLIIVARAGRDCLESQLRLSEANVFAPIVIISEIGTVAMSVTAMKYGAVDFLVRPCTDDDVLRSIKIGLARDRARKDENQLFELLSQRYAKLTPRERQVMEKVTDGRLNKQTANDLGISEITVKAHRGQMMRKMEAQSLPDLTRMADKIFQLRPRYVLETGRPTEKNGYYRPALTAFTTSLAFSFHSVLPFEPISVESAPRVVDQASRTSL